MNDPHDTRMLARPFTRALEFLGAPKWLIAIASVGLAAGAVVSVAEPRIGILAALAAVAALVAFKRPHWPLAVAAFLALVDGPLPFASGVIAGAAAVSVVPLLRAMTLRTVFVLGLVALVLAWMFVRFLVAGAPPVIWSITICIGAVVVAAEVARRGIRVEWALAVAGGAFAVASLVFGSFNEQGTRLYGLSGNPNRLALAIGVLLAGLLALAAVADGVRRVLLIAGIALCVVMLILTGSAQGVVYLGLVAVGVYGVVVAKLRGRARSVALLGGGLVAVLVITGFAIVVALVPGLARDLLSLSDRLPMFEAAWTEFLEQPWFGTGTDRVTSGAIVERSAHSAVLALLASGGVVPGAVWAILLVLLSWAGARSLVHGDLRGLAPLVIVVAQFVQTTQYLVIWWVVAIPVLLGSLSPRRASAAETLLVSRSFYPHEGGAERQMRQVALELAGRGSSVLVVTTARPGRPRVEVLAPGCEIRRVGLAHGPGPLGKVAFVVAAVLAGLAARPRVVVSVQLGGATVAGALIARASGIPQIVRLTGGGSSHFRSEPLARASSPFGRLIVSLVPHRRAVLVAPARHLLTDAAEAFPRFTDRRRLPNGVREGTATTKKVAEVVWYSRRGAEQSVDSFLAVVRAMPDVSFTVMGADPGRELPANVTFLGWRDDPEAVLGQHAVLVNTSAQEGSPNTALQALAAGCRVVGFDNPGMAELRDDYPDRVIVAGHDATAMTRAVREALGAGRPRGLVHVPTTEQATEEWAKLILELAARETAPAAGAR